MNPTGKNSSNSLSLAGEFAVLSRLALMDYTACMTLGNTKSVDILVSKPNTNKFYRLEVKTTKKNTEKPASSHLFGKFLANWMMNEKHESISDPDLWYCFVVIYPVNIPHEKKQKFTIRYFIVPSPVVAKYVKAEHRLWMKATPNCKETAIRTFRIGLKGEKYKISTPTLDQYEDNWNFKR